MRAVGVAVVGCFVGGCVADVAEFPTDPPPPAETGTFGVVVQPRLGTLVPGPTNTASITFAGVHQRSSYPITIQVFDRYDNDWATIATTTTSTDPSSTDQTMHEWQVSAAPAQLSPRRWTQGGIVHLRVLGGDGEVLTALFHDADACLDSNEGWRARAASCGADLTMGITVVSPADVTTAAIGPKLLDARGWIDATETSAYYQTIAAPATLDAFRTKFAIDTTAASSTYYNAGDLGIGREMHCQPQPGGGLACAVSNYGTFGGDSRDALDRAVSGVGAFATVAMVYQPPITAPNSVQFMVYGANGALATTARLDTHGDNEAVPNNCLNCHGSLATYDSTTHAVTGARFLPFDAAGLEFSTRSGFTAAEQQPALAQLNTLVRNGAVSPGHRELVDGWYAAGGTRQALDFVPAAWRTSTIDQKVYQYVVSETCRGCHTSRDDTYSFTNTDAFWEQAAKIADIVCTTHGMPNAEVPLHRMWSGPARAYLAEYLSLVSCDP